jgi:hypothetical protein
MAYKRNDERFNDCGYQQENTINVKLVNFEPNPGSVNKIQDLTSKKIQKLTPKKLKLFLTKEPCISSVLQLTREFTVS